jgi:GAF domain-containing protein
VKAARPAGEIAARFDEILAALRAAAGASRVTLRIDWPAHGFHSDDVAGESLAPGVKSLRGQTSIPQRAAGTIRWLDRERRVLVQEELRGAEPAPPPALLAIYGTTAQMLGPLVRGGKLAGWVSVHHNGGPRAWQPHEVAALEAALVALDRELDQEAFAG